MGEMMKDFMEEFRSSQLAPSMTTSVGRPSDVQQQKVVSKGNNLDRSLNLLSPGIRQKVINGDYIELEMLLPSNLSTSSGDLNICLSLTPAGLTPIRRPQSARIDLIES